MRFNKIVSTCIALCIMATLAVAMNGCDDLGAYENTEEYYDAFGDIVLISGTSKVEEEYSVEKYFYNEDSREDFLEGEDGSYKGVPYSDYVYMAIPFESTINMDSLALYMRAQSDATVYINVFVTDKIPTAWKSIEDNVINNDETDASSDEESSEETEETTEETIETEETEESVETTEESVETEETAETEKTEKVYDDPAPESRVGEIAVYLKAGKWGSFLLDKFVVDGTTQKSIEIKEGQYILLQIRNNSGVRAFDEEKQIFVDFQTGLDLQKIDITMTNLLIRALDIKNVNEVQGGE